MFFGREAELQRLRELYEDKSFQFLILYGRRRVGKTTLLQEFAGKHEVLFFSAQEKNDALNLSDFSKMLQMHFDQTFIAPFPDWNAALSYLTTKSEGKGKVTLIIDEFPFIAKQNPSVKSSLQHIIDHSWKDRNMMLILCGSSVSFMLNDVMGYESPLYGRSTCTMEVHPFDYSESALFFPKYSPEDRAIAYGILGGIPRYIVEFDPSVSVRENIKRKIVQNGTFLNDEPNSMLRMEVREPGVYASILEAISKGYNQIKIIAEHIHEDQAKVSKYMTTLLTLRLVEKLVPCTESADSKKAIYELTDPFFAFWYRHIFSERSYYEYLGVDGATDEIMDGINDYMGHAFEKICLQYMKHRAIEKKLPFTPAVIGRWWGNNPAIKSQDDVDVMAISKKGDEALFCECKFTNKQMPMAEYDDLVTATLAFPEIKRKHLMFISKSGFTKPVVERATKEGVELLTIEDLY